MQTLTLKSQIKHVAVKLNTGSNLPTVAKEIGISDKQLSNALKKAGYTYKERKWSHRDYTSPLRELTVYDLMNNIKVKYYLRDQLKALDPYVKVTKRMAADESTIEAFEEFCDNNNLMRPRALTMAMREFMDKHSK